MNSPIQDLNKFGQSIWYDNIQRCLLEKSPEGKIGSMAAMIENGDIRGVTSNPSIFHNAISNTNDYDSALVPLAWSGWDAEKIFWQLAIEDIQNACDLFSGLYQKSGGADGYVSLEVDPVLAHSNEETLAQVKQLWERVARPNLMVKIPATLECLPAIRDAIAAGININATLIFSIERYRAVMDAYLSGLDIRLANRLPVDHIASVASFFVSRMDTKVDSLLPERSSLRGKTAIAYTKITYDEFRKVFGGDRFARLQAVGCRLQRPLWASTSTKNAAYPDTLYVDNLIGPGTVNTVPPQTLEAFRDHGIAKNTLMDNLDEARKVIQEVDSLGVSMETVTAELENEGVKSFAAAFAAMITTIDARRSILVNSLGPLAIPVKQCVSSMIAENVSSRLWSHDATLWTMDKAGQDEVKKRLGWLYLPHSSISALKEIHDFVSETDGDGFKNILLLGMGGSSLAPEVFSLVFSDLLQNRKTFSILDSTDPSQVLATDRANQPNDTLYILSSKSGGTAEINAMFNYFWERTGHDGNRFVAITDPATPLEALADARGFRKTFLSDPSVGGRYSALSHFGMVPAALIGIDLEQLLGRASWMMEQCASEVVSERNPGLVLGAILGRAAVGGRDKLTFLADESVAPLGTWLEQLIAESSGKLGKGIIPVEGERITDPEKYGSDRLFVYLRREGYLDANVKALQEFGHPVLIFSLQTQSDIGAEFYRWEVAIAVASSLLGVNAFDQPDVQDAKERTKHMITAYSQSGNFDEGQPLWEQVGVKAFSTINLTGNGLANILKVFLDDAKTGDYIAINAYLPRNPEMVALLTELRLSIREKTGFATTMGFGPRFLHSTGQLHKGGPNEGLFLQITTEPEEDVEIPGLGMSFGTLEQAQALGDYEALAARGRRILRLNLSTPKNVQLLVNALKW
jgi:transaldolase / glucose-6-phosphate isomerase